MEHIRHAIEKARKKRMESEGQSDTAAHQDQKLSEAAALSAKWRALRSTDVRPAVFKRNRITTFRAGPQAAPFDAMRTKLLYEMRGKNWRRLAITSPGVDCGKSTICLNLAFSMARQLDLKVMVIELDLRHPSIARMLNLDSSMNLVKVLNNVAPAQDHMTRIGEDMIIAPSQRTQDSAELLQGVAAAHAIDRLEADYQPDVMLFDMPPMLAVDDTMAFVDQVDATLLIGAAEATTADQIARCKRDLEARTNLIGVVLNKCRYPDPLEAYSYGI